MTHTDLTNDAEQILVESRKNAGIFGLGVVALVLVGAAFLVAWMLVLQGSEKPVLAKRTCDDVPASQQLVCWRTVAMRAGDRILQGCGK